MNGQQFDTTLLVFAALAGLKDAAEMDGAENLLKCVEALENAYMNDWTPMAAQILTELLDKAVDADQFRV